MVSAQWQSDTHIMCYVFACCLPCHFVYHFGSVCYYSSAHCDHLVCFHRPMHTAAMEVMRQTTLNCVPQWFRMMARHATRMYYFVIDRTKCRCHARVGEPTIVERSVFEDILQCMLCRVEKCVFIAPNRHSRSQIFDLCHELICLCTFFTE